MADNIRDSTSNLYTGPIKYGDYTHAGDMQVCGYCGIQFPGCLVQPICVTRNGKRRDLWRCNQCRDEMRTFKPTDN